MTTLKERLAELSKEEREELASELGGGSEKGELLKTIEALQTDISAIKKHVGFGEKKKKTETVSVWDKFFGAA